MTVGFVLIHMDLSIVVINKLSEGNFLFLPLAAFVFRVIVLFIIVVAFGGRLLLFGVLFCVLPHKFLQGSDPRDTLPILMLRSSVIESRLGSFNVFEF